MMSWITPDLTIIAFGPLILCCSEVESSLGNKLRELKPKFNFLQILMELQQQKNFGMNYLHSSVIEDKTPVSLSGKNPLGIQKNTKRISYH